MKGKPMEKPKPTTGRTWWVLIDTCYGFTGGDLYVCNCGCGSRCVVRAETYPSVPPHSKAEAGR